MNWLRRHKLLAELLQASVSAWGKFEKDEEGMTFDFTLEHPVYGHISVKCEDCEDGAKAGLYVNDKQICGASGLYNYLIGKWSCWDMNRFRARLQRLACDAWQQNGLSYITDLNGDQVRVAQVKHPEEEPEYRLYVNGKLISKNEEDLWTYVDLLWRHALSKEEVEEYS